MLKVLVTCGNGMGSSLMMKLKAEGVFKKLGLDATIEHAPIGQAVSMANSFDLVFCPLSLIDQFKDFTSKDRVKIISLVNVISEKEMEQKLRENGYVK